MSTPKRTQSRPACRPLSEASPAYLARTRRLVKEVSASLAMKYQVEAKYIEIESGLFGADEGRKFSYARVTTVYTVFNKLRMGFDILDPALKPRQLIDKELPGRELLRISRQLRMDVRSTYLLWMIAFEVHLRRARLTG